MYILQFALWRLPPTCSSPQFSWGWDAHADIGMKLMEAEVGAGGLSLLLGRVAGLGMRGRSQPRLWDCWSRSQVCQCRVLGGGSLPSRDCFESGSDPSCPPLLISEGQELRMPPPSPFVGLGSPAGLLWGDMPWGGIPSPGMAASGLMDKHRIRHFLWRLSLWHRVF